MSNPPGGRISLDLYIDRAEVIIKRQFSSSPILPISMSCLHMLPPDKCGGCGGDFRSSKTLNYLGNNR